VKVPPSATIAAGQSSVTFIAVVAAISDTESAVITAQGNNTPVSFGLDLSPGFVIEEAANSASYDTDLVCSPGSLASVFGIGFTSGTIDQALAVPYPKKLAGVELAVGGVPASLLYVSDRMINFQCPNEDLSSPVMVAVTRANGDTVKYQVAWDKVSPGIFTTNMTGHGQGVVFVAGTQLIAGPEAAGSRPAHPGESIEIFATGLGAAPPQHSRRRPLGVPLVLSVSLAIGGQQLPSAQAAPAPSFDGLWHITAPLPSDIQTGDTVPLQLNVRLSDGRVVSSNVVTIAIQAAAASGSTGE